MSSILITGGTGLIGKHLCRLLKDKGHKVVLLSRNRSSNTDVQTYAWDLEKGEIDKEALESADYIIHLAGENIGDKRWTQKQKQLIIDSRVKTTKLIFDKIKENNITPKAFISASATGYYGISPTDKIFEETDPPGKDFLGDTCSQWEQAVDRFKQLGVRTVKIRTGVVLTKQGGALAKMTVPVKMGIASALGNGRQYLPWIHIEDLCSIYMKAIEDSQMNGAYNAVAPDYKTNAEFTRTLAKVLNKPFWLPNVSGMMIKLLLGKMSEIVLKGNRISANKIIGSGYKFQFPDLERALKNLFDKN
jgi:uncharacterized protein